MTANIAMGLLLTAATVVIHSVGLVVLTELMRRIVGLLPRRNGAASKTIAVTLLASGLVVLLGAEISLWALTFVWLGVLQDLETSLYFSTSTFATIGFGDVAPAQEWRLLASMQGVVGFVIFGWSAAYLVASGIRFGPFERDKHF
jgi:hypothetical protein